MADAVTVNTIADTKTHVVVHLTNISDGTGESAVKKVDITAVAKAATDAGVARIQPVSLDVEQLRWSVQGFTSVRLLWDHTTDDLIMALAGNGYDDFRGHDRAVTDRRDAGGLRDPRSAGADGSILLTTNGGLSGATYDITIWLHKAVV